MLYQRLERERQRGRIGLAERDEGTTATLDEQHAVASDGHDERAGDARRTTGCMFRPWKRGSVGLRGIGSGNDRGLRRLIVVQALAEPLDRAGQGELRTPEALDEVAAPTDAQRLERTKLVVHRGVTHRARLRPERRLV